MVCLKFHSNFGIELGQRPQCTAQLTAQLLLDSPLLCLVSQRVLELTRHQSG